MSQILVTNLVTLFIPAIHFAWIPYDPLPPSPSLNRFLPGVTGEFHKLKNNIIMAQNLPHKFIKIMAQNNASQFHKITIHPDVS